MPIHFATSAVTVSQLFSGSHTYRMPEFQRPYSWPDDRAVQLFDDLESACVASASRTSSATEYFLGALIVTQQSPRAPFLIVDGQQRLVTLAAILAILRDHLPQGDFRARLHERIERPADQAADYQKAPRIELRDIDQDEFVRWVIKDGGTVRLPRISETRSTAKLRTPSTSSTKISRTPTRNSFAAWRPSFSTIVASSRSPPIASTTPTSSSRASTTPVFP